jgi:hypothetical protein
MYALRSSLIESALLIVTVNLHHLLGRSLDFLVTKTVTSVYICNVLRSLELMWVFAIRVMKNVSSGSIFSSRLRIGIPKRDRVLGC